MGTFNTLFVDLTCPRCGVHGEVAVDFRFGYRNQFEYRMGDSIVWEGSNRDVPRKRPSSGNHWGEGYTECLHCRKDFWCTVYVEKDHFTRVVVDPHRPGYIP